VAKKERQVRSQPAAHSSRTKSEPRAHSLDHPPDLPVAKICRQPVISHSPTPSSLVPLFPVPSFPCSLFPRSLVPLFPCSLFSCFLVLRPQIEEQNTQNYLHSARSVRFYLYLSQKSSTSRRTFLPKKPLTAKCPPGTLQKQSHSSAHRPTNASQTCAAAAQSWKLGARSWKLNFAENYPARAHNRNRENRHTLPRSATHEEHRITRRQRSLLPRKGRYSPTRNIVIPRRPVSHDDSPRHPPRQMSALTASNRRQ
jgi:hypothetical protein